MPTAVTAPMPVSATWLISSEKRTVTRSMRPFALVSAVTASMIAGAARSAATTEKSTAWSLPAESFTAPLIAATVGVASVSTPCSPTVRSTVAPEAAAPVTT